MVFWGMDVRFITYVLQTIVASTGGLVYLYMYGSQGPQNSSYVSCVLETRIQPVCTVQKRMGLNTIVGLHLLSIQADTCTVQR
jgi:hypothetical protein